MTQMTDLIDKNAKTIIITIFHMFKKESFHLLNRQIKDIKTSLKQNNWKCVSDIKIH